MCFFKLNYEIRVLPEEYEAGIVHNFKAKNYKKGFKRQKVNDLISIDISLTC